VRLKTLFSEMFVRYAFVAGITHSAHTGLFTVLTFVVLGFFLMSRVDFSTVGVMFVSSGVLLIIVWLTPYEGSLGSYVATA
jgi:accessory gene regulator protein AgrB